MSWGWYVKQRIGLCFCSQGFNVKASVQLSRERWKANDRTGRNPTFHGLCFEHLNYPGIDAWDAEVENEGWRPCRMVGGRRYRVGRHWCLSVCSKLMWLDPGGLMRWWGPGNWQKTKRYGKSVWCWSGSKKITYFLVVYYVSCNEYRVRLRCH